MLHLLRNSLGVAALFLLALPAYAAPIDSAHKYAWSNAGGWVNFAPTQGGVEVADSGLSGYAWAQNTGWINFDTAQSGVINDGTGNLSGFAWSEGEGWLSFTGVTIDSDGRFHGTATGADSTLTFDCTNCDVRTGWESGASSGSSSGGNYRVSPSQTTTPSEAKTDTPPSSSEPVSVAADAGIPFGSGAGPDGFENHYPTSTVSGDIGAPSASSSPLDARSAQLAGFSAGVIGTGLALVLLLIFAFLRYRARRTAEPI